MADRVRSFPGLGYSLKRSALREVESSLTRVRRLAFLHLGNSKIHIPSTPEWGNSGDSERIWSPNDFEILMTCFYEEVESYLSYLGAHLPGEEEEAAEESLYVLKGKKKAPLSSQVIREEQEPTQDESEEETYPDIPKTRIERDLPPHLSVPILPVGNDLLKTNKERRRVSLHFPDYNQALGDLSSVPVFASANPNQFHHQESVTPQRKKDLLQSGKRSLPPMIVEITSSEPDDDPGSDSSDSSDDGPGKGRPHKAPPRRKPKTAPEPLISSPATPPDMDKHKYLFETKFKTTDVPEWDGNPDTLAKWIRKVSQLADRSPYMFKQLGTLVPQRLTHSAETWYWSLPADRRQKAEKNWQTIRDYVKGYYMTRSWLDKQKARANRASYRDSTHPRETPSEYYIRKYELLMLVYNLSETELIMEIMNGAPSSWVSILNPHLYDDVTDFQSAIRYHEENLMRMDGMREPPESRRYFFKPKDTPLTSRTHLVGSSGRLDPPKFPKDDSNVSKRTPESIGARPCRHCGSGKH
jgi:hypothetical protein